MLKILAGLLLSITAFAISFNTADQAELGFENLLRNPGAEQGVVGWTGTNATVATGTTAANVRSGKSSFTWTATSAAGYVESGTVNVKPGTNNCEVSGYYKTTAADATVGVYFGATLIRQETLPAASTLTKISNFSFVCSDTSSAYKVRFSFPTDGTVLYFDDGYLGANRDIGSVAQAEFVGSIEFGTNCQWGTTSTSYTTLTDGDGCTTTVVGAVSIAGSVRPAATVTNARPGRYAVIYNGNYSTEVTNKTAAFRLHDGTNAISGESMLIGGASSLYLGGTIFGDVTYTVPQTSVTFDVQAISSSGNTAYLGNNAYTKKISIYYYPTSQQTVARFDVANAFAAVKIAPGSGQTITSSTTSFVVASDSDIVAGDKTHYGKSVITSTAGDVGFTVNSIPPGTYSLSMTAEMFSVYTGGEAQCVFGISDDGGSTSLGSGFTHSEISSTAYDSIATVTAIVKYDTVVSKTFHAVVKNNNGTGLCYFENSRIPVTMTLTPLSQNLPQPLVINSVTTQKQNVQRIVHGVLTSCGGGTGITNSGTGDWTVTTTATGICKVNFSPAFSSTNYSCTAVVTSGNARFVGHRPANSTAAQADFAVFDVSGNLQNEPISFQCIGDK